MCDAAARETACSYFDVREVLSGDVEAPGDDLINVKLDRRLKARQDIVSCEGLVDVIVAHLVQFLLILVSSESWRWPWW